MKNAKEHFGEDWAKLLGPFLASKEFKAIGKTLVDQHTEGKTIYPLFDQVFRGFKECPLDKLKIVMLSTNCYMKGEGDGIPFSANKVEFLEDTPPVLVKIFDAVERDTEKGLYLNRNTDLSRWSNQGILLLNLDLTVIAGKHGSHIELWKPFIEYVIKTLDKRLGLIYVFIGKQAEKYVDMIDPITNDYYIIEHPINAVIGNRDWDSEKIFWRLKTACQFIHNTKINWA